MIRWSCVKGGERGCRAESSPEKHFKCLFNVSNIPF